ncbi:MAG: M15 family metallopeptidase [Syntrophales bacterium]|nr:M15 family metallopeptidase [Syntrophales bacterium]
MKRILFLAIIMFSPGLILFAQNGWPESRMPADIMDVEEAIPGVALDIRYYSPHNFVGAKVDGYEAPKCLLTGKAATALAKVQAELKAFSLSLKIYDCYRPQRAVDHFVRWAGDINDTLTKGEFYPTVDKRHLFRDGYIAKKSGHSRGSTIDLTIVPLPLPEQETYRPGQPLHACFSPVGGRFRDNSIDMGTGYDCFHELSHPVNMKVGEQQRANRLLLKTLMDKYGFKNYDQEWWHFTLRNEPYPNTYFDFPVK